MVTRLSCGFLALGGFFVAGCYVGVHADAGNLDPDSDAAGTTGDAADEGGSESGDESGGDVPAGCEAPDVGLSGMRRLSRMQYVNSVRDLVGVDVDPDALPLDEEADSVGPFPSNIVAPVSELNVREYMEVAESIAETLRADPGAPLVAPQGSLLPCDPATTGETECARQFILTFGLRALRRPLSDDEIADYESAYAAAAADGGFEDGIGLVVESMLQSPHFLYLVEFGTQGDGPVVRLDDYELASRLSYFLWSSSPDDELLEAAGTGALSASEGLRAQAERLLAAPRARDTIAAFHTQWLRSDDIVSAYKVEDVYPEFDTELAQMMLRETEAFADYVVREGDGRLSTLLTAPYTIAEPRLAELYGVSADEIGADGVVPLDPTQRVGMLMHASWLGVHAHGDQASPIKRGVMIRNRVLCNNLPPPPGDADVTPPPLDPTLPTRERFDLHRDAPACAACHELIDPLGFGFLNFDGIGRHTDVDGGQPVDASGEALGSDLEPATFSGPVELAHALAGSDQVRDCFATQWVTFAVGHPPADEAEDRCAVDALRQRFADTDGDIADLLVAIATSDTFTHTRLESGE